MSTFSKFLESQPKTMQLNEADRDLGYKAVYRLIANNQTIGKTALNSYNSEVENSVVLDAHDGKMTTLAYPAGNGGIEIVIYHDNGIEEKIILKKHSFELLKKLK